MKRCTLPEGRSVALSGKLLASEATSCLHSGSIYISSFLCAPFSPSLSSDYLPYFYLRVPSHPGVMTVNRNPTILDAKALISASEMEASCAFVMAHALSFKTALVRSLCVPSRIPWILLVQVALAPGPGLAVL